MRGERTKVDSSSTANGGECVVDRCRWLRERCESQAVGPSPDFAVDRNQSATGRGWLASAQASKSWLYLKLRC